MSEGNSIGPLPSQSRCCIKRVIPSALSATESSCSASASDSCCSTIVSVDEESCAEVLQNNNTCDDSYSFVTKLFCFDSFKRKAIAFLPLLPLPEFYDDACQKSTELNGFLSLSQLQIQSQRMASRGIDRNVRQTFPTTQRRKARTSPRSSSVSTEGSKDLGEDIERSTLRSESQDSVSDAEREFQRLYEHELDSRLNASDLAMEAMEYKFLSRRKRLMARKMAREAREKSDPRIEEMTPSMTLFQRGLSPRMSDPRIEEMAPSMMTLQQRGLSPRIDENGNRVYSSSAVHKNGAKESELFDPSKGNGKSVSPQLSLSISTKMDTSNVPEAILDVPQAARAALLSSTPLQLSPVVMCASSVPIESVKTHERDHEHEELKYPREKYLREDNADSDTIESISKLESKDKRIKRFSSTTLQQSDSDYDDSGCALTDPTVMTDASRAVSRGSFSASSARPLSSEIESSAWGSQEMIESDESHMKRIVKSRHLKSRHGSADDDIDTENVEKISIFQDADEEYNGKRDTEAQEGDPHSFSREIQAQVFKEFEDLERAPLETPAAYEVIDMRSSRIKYDNNGEGRIHTPPSATGVSLGHQLLKSSRRTFRPDGRRSTSDPQHSSALLYPSHYRRGSLATPVSYHYSVPSPSIPSPPSLVQSSSSPIASYMRPTVASLRARYEHDDDRVAQSKKSDDSQIQLARAYRRRVIPDENDEMIFPISRKTQTRPEIPLTHEVKMVSRASQTEVSSLNRMSIGVNTEIDLRLMSALLDKLLIPKRDIGISTERVFRERYSPLPNTKSQYQQTDASLIKKKNKSVTTDPEITGLRSHQNRSLKEPSRILLGYFSREIQTDSYFNKKDVSVEANFSYSSFSSESEDSVIMKGSPYPKGFHPKTGKMLDDSLISSPRFKDYQISKMRDKSVQEMPYVPSSAKRTKTPEPIIEEFSSSSSSSSSSADTSEEETVTIPKKSEIKEKREYMPQKYKDNERDYERTYKDNERTALAKDGKKRLREEKSTVTSDVKREFTPSVKSTQTQTTNELIPSPESTLKNVPSVESQIPTQIPTAVRFMAKDLRTESKIIVEVTQSRRKEKSEVTSFTQVDDDGKLSRRTQVTTSRHVPVAGQTPYRLDANRERIQLKDSSPRTDPISSSSRSLSPVRKAQSEMNMTSASEASTRPASAIDPLTSSMPLITTIPSILTPPSSSMSYVKSPMPDEVDVPRVGRVNIQDPLHLVVLAPPDSFVSKDVSYRKDDTSLRTIPSEGSVMQWREASYSTISNEMTTDAFKDEDGNVQRPESLSFTSETLIDNTGKESKVHTRSRTARKYSPFAEEAAVTTDTAMSSDMFPDNGTDKMINSAPIVPPHEFQSPKQQMYSHSRNVSPIVQLPETPDTMFSPEPTPKVKKQKTKKKRKDKDGDERVSQSLIEDAPTSLQSDDRHHKMSNGISSPTAAKLRFLEPIVPPMVPSVPAQKSAAVLSTGDGTDRGMNEKTNAPGTEIITRITRTSQPDTNDPLSRKSRTVLEQELQSGNVNDLSGGCRISSSVIIETPPQRIPIRSSSSRGVIIKELNEDGTSKHGSMDDLDQTSGSRPQSQPESHSGSQTLLDPSTAGGEIITETNFQRYKTPPRNGTNGETSWKYSMECNCVSGAATTVRTIVTHRRALLPPDSMPYVCSYETSL